MKLGVNLFLFNPFLDISKSENLIFESGRKYVTDNGKVDIYTEYLCREFKSSNISFKRYETNREQDDLLNNIASKKHIDMIDTMTRILKVFLSVKLTRKDSELIKKIEASIFSTFSYKMNLEEIIVSEIKKYRIQYVLYRLLFLLKKPSNIFLVNYTNKSGLIRAAKDLNIVVIELQHGLIVSNGIVGHFPHVPKDSLQYFPNRYYLWIDINMCTAELPLSSKNIKYIQHPLLWYYKNKYRHIRQNPKQLLVISQPYYSKEIYQYIRKNASDLDQWKIIYKIHPEEDKNTFDEDSASNIDYISNQISIYELFNSSSFVLGIFSTAVIEASYFGCKLIMLNLPGVELVEPLIKDRTTTLVNANQSLATILSGLQDG